ncbi:hypothetical protein [Streptomyces sp. T028]|uniref:hypothetical protein n=1 Tax=Streptomyces sp. T028 TaxID=3394379 RepID=UPI003A873643
MSVRGQVVALARSLADVLAVVHRIGIALEWEEAGATPLVEWQGGGFHVWRKRR